MYVICTNISNSKAAHSSFRRLLATETVAQTPPTSSTQPPRSKKSLRPHISTAIILNRSPIITRTPTLFEQAYYAYQARLRRALHNPFPYDFYFKQGTLLETRFNIEERKRERLAFGPGFLEKEDVSEEKRAADIAAVEQLALQEGEGEELMPRIQPENVEGDVKSLDRKGKRNLYLLLHTLEDGKDVWRFPQGDVEKGQFLHQVSRDPLKPLCFIHYRSLGCSKRPLRRMWRPYGYLDCRQSSCRSL